MRAVLLLLVIAFLGLHAGLGWVLHKDRPNLAVVPALPSAAAVSALSFGDAQYLYRAFALQIQNAGDTGGRFTKMTDYNMKEVVPWLVVLQGLDPRSNLYPFLAMRYFSLLRTGDDLRMLINFIDHDVDLAPERKWFWQTQIVTMARHKLNDMGMALELSRKLKKFAPYLPIGFVWVLQIEPALLADMGRKDDARALMEWVVQVAGNKMNEAEKNWTANFFQKLN